MKVWVGFSRPRGVFLPIFSMLVRLIERTPYSHVYVRWTAPSVGVEIVYHASGSSVHFLSRKRFEQKVHVTDEFLFEVTRETYRKLLRFCLENAGVNYGVRQVLGIGLVRLAEKFGWKIRNPFSDGLESQVCSELVGHILRDVLGEAVNDDLDTAGPRKIYEIVSQNRKEAA